MARLLCCIAPVGGGDPFLLSQCMEGKVKSKLTRINPLCFSDGSHTAFVSCYPLLIPNQAHGGRWSLGPSQGEVAGTHTGQVTNPSPDTHHSPTPVQSSIKHMCRKLHVFIKKLQLSGKVFNKTNSASGIPAPFNAVRVTIIGRPSTVWAELMVCRSRLDWIFNWQRQPLFVEATS